MTLRRWIITITLCLLVVISLGSIKFFQIKEAIAFGKSFPEPSATVKATYSVASEYRQQLTVSGELIAPQQLELRTELGGKINKLNLPSGGQVDKDQVLLQLDVSEEQARLRAANVSARLAKLTLDRNKKLRKQNRVSAEALDQAEANYQTALAEIAAQKAVISKKTILAPFAGSIGLHTLEVGQYLNPNTMISQLIGNNDFIWVDFSVPQNFPSLNQDSDIVVKLNSGQSLNAKLLARDAQVNSGSRQLRYRARIEKPDELILNSNSIVDIQLGAGQKQNAAWVPDVSITRDQFADYIYLLKADQSGEFYRAKRLRVELGPRHNEGFLLRNELAQDALIASIGAFKLRDGLKVFVQDDTVSDKAGAIKNAQ